MNDPTLGIAVWALAMLSPIFLGCFLVERRRHRIIKNDRRNLERQWIERGRAMTDVIVDIVDQNKKFQARLEQTCSLMEVAREENKQAMMLMREILRK